MIDEQEFNSKLKIIEKDESKFPYLYKIKCPICKNDYVISKYKDGNFDIEFSDCEDFNLKEEIIELILEWIEEEVKE